MAKDNQLIAALDAFAVAKAASLPPGWESEVDGENLPDGMAALAVLCARLGWPAPQQISTRPRPDQFPLLIWSPKDDFGVAEQWNSETVCVCV